MSWCVRCRTLLEAQTAWVDVSRAKKNGPLFRSCLLRDCLPTTATSPPLCSQHHHIQARARGKLAQSTRCQISRLGFIATIPNTLPAPDASFPDLWWPHLRACKRASTRSPRPPLLDPGEHPQKQKKRRRKRRMSGHCRCRQRTIWLLPDSCGNPQQPAQTTSNASPATVS